MKPKTDKKSNNPYLTARLGQKEETAGVLEQCLTIIEQLDGEDMLNKESELLNELAQVHGNIGKFCFTFLLQFTNLITKIIF